MASYDKNNIFAKIMRGEIPSNKVLETDHVYAFEDINPQAPIHILIIPKEEVATVNDFGEEHKDLIGEIFLAAQKIAKDKGIAEDGYRLVFNCNRHGGQEVYHVHLHLLGGRPMKWPPG
jgi:histidine triad (HIT) family protein